MLNLNKRDCIGKNIRDLNPHLANSESYEKYVNVLKTGKPVFLQGLSNPIKKGRYINVFAFKAFGGLGLIVSDVTKSYLIEEHAKNSVRLLQKLSHHDLILREEESRRIAREIHDEMAPILSTFNMDLSWILSKLKAEAKPDPSLEKRVREMSGLIVKTIQSVKKICSELRPALLDDLGLFDAIEWQIQESQKRFPIKCRLFMDCNGLELSRDLSTCIFRIFQEAFTNVLRHARATKVFVSLKQSPAKNTVLLKIRDNGRGIRPEEIANPKSFGLIGMRERLSPYAGQMKIHSVPDKGTSLTFSIPVARTPFQNGHR